MFPGFQSKMSMVLFASVVRVRDGLPLSASTDYEQDKGLQETRKHLKGLSKKLGHFPDRSFLKTGQYNIKYVTCKLWMDFFFCVYSSVPFFDLMMYRFAM